MSERFFTTSLLASSEKNFFYLALSSHMPVQKTVAHPRQSGTGNQAICQVDKTAKVVYTSTIKHRE